MADDNSEQIAEWNGALGDRWVEYQAVLDRFTAPFGDAAMTAAAPRPGEHVIDIGCGCGDTSIALARAVGEKGAVLGVDVSRPMLGLAQKRGAALKHLGFREADASTADLPNGQDLLFSRFGIMFFADPPAAFSHLRRALKDTGRLAFACWRAPRENPWAITPVMAGREALDLNPPPSDPHAPGPFAFADDARVRSILQEAGFRDIVATPFEAPIRLGSTAREAAENAARTGPLARLVRETGPQHLPRIVEAVEKAFGPLAAADGSVSLPGRTWTVTARAG